MRSPLKPTQSIKTAKRYQPKPATYKQRPYSQLIMYQFAFILVSAKIGKVNLHLLNNADWGYLHTVHRKDS